MNKKQILTVMICVSMIAAGGPVIAKEKKQKGLTTEKDKLSYTIGANIAQSLVPIKEDVDMDKVMMGINDQMDGKASLVDPQEAQAIMQSFSMKMQQKMMEEAKVIGEKNLIEGQNFLNENKEKKGVLATDSGLQYMVVKEGEGPKPAQTDRVKVHYQGTTINGNVFDSSYERGEPIVFPVTGVIPGWTEALQLMNVGSQYKLYIPSELAYGPRGAGPNIGPNAVLIFDVELLGIE